MTATKQTKAKLRRKNYEKVRNIVRNNFSTAVWKFQPVTKGLVKRVLAVLEANKR